MTPAVRTASVPGELAVCPGCGEQNAADGRFCITCGRPMAPVSGERRVVSVLFADARGFTAFSATAEPELVRTTADAITTTLRSIVEGHGGTVDKVISENGLKVMALFGAPIAHEDDPERGIRAALAMQEAAARKADAFGGLSLGIGVTTGEAIYAPVGPSGEHTVLGDTVNTAARLQAAARAGEVLLGLRTHEAVARTIDTEELPPIAAKGKVEPVRAWRAIGRREVDGPSDRRHTPMVGRVHERTTLRALWRRSRDEGTRSFAAIVGAAGIGKSRLLGAFRTEVRDDAEIVTGHCLPYGEGITYWPISEIIRGVAGILHDDDPSAVSGRLGAMLEGLGIDDLDQLRTIAVAVANLVAAPTTPRGTYRATEISRAELHWGVRRLFELLAARRPLVLIIEDLHWAEPTLAELIEFLIDGDEPAPVLVLATARPEFVNEVPPLLDPKANRRVLTLGPLGDDEVATLLAALAGPAADRALATTLSAAGGNPLFIEEIVRMLLDRGVIDEGGRVTGDLSLVDVPESLQGLIDARLDRLGHTERTVAGHASVVGRVFWDGAVGRLWDGDVRPTLRTLADRAIAYRSPTSSIAGEEEWAFSHIMLRDVAYGRVPKVERAALHARCGDWIKALPVPDDEYVEFVAYHLEQACRLARDVGDERLRPPTLAAVDALMHAARKAEDHEGTAEADRYYARGLEILGDGYPEARIQLSLNRAETRALLGDLAGAADLLRSVAAATERVDRDDLRCRALLGLANLIAATSTTEARALLDEADAIARAIGDRRLQIVQALGSGFLRAIYEGSPEAAIDEMRAALDAATIFGDPMLRISAHLRLANLTMNAGHLDQAEEHFTQAAALAREQGSIRDETEATRFLATVKYYRGPREEAEALARRALGWLERNPNRIVEVQTLSRAAWLAVARGDLPEALERLGAARALGDAIGGWMRVEVLRNLAVVLGMAGRIEDADEAAGAAREAVPEGDDYADACAALAEASVAAARGDAARARERFEHALPLLAGEPLDEGQAHLWYARALRAFGDETSAREHFGRARSIFAAVGATAVLDDIGRDEGA